MRRRSAAATLAGSTAITFVAAMQSLVLLPLYLSEVGPRLYGAWLATGEVFVWLLAFDFGIPNLMIQRVGSHLAKGERSEIGHHFATSLIALASVGVIVCTVVGLGAPWIAGALGVGGSEASSLVVALRIGVVATAIMLLDYGFVGLARGMQDTTLVQAVALSGVILGFGVTAGALLSGLGIVSIALGLAVRASVSLLGGLVYFFWRLDRDVRRSVRPSKDALTDIKRNCPAMFAAGIGYALMNNSMVTIAALAFRPEAATVLGVTRKAADLVRSVLDMIGHASYGGFSHLHAEGERVRVRDVYRELDATYIVAAVALLAAYVAANPTLIANWVGPKMYGGAALTLALAAATATGAWSYMQIALYRSMGNHGAASAALLLECFARLIVMVGLALWIGPVGLPLGVVATSLVSGTWASRRIRATFCDDLSQQPSRQVWVWRLAPLAGASLVCFMGVLGGWGVAVGAGVAAAATASVLIVMTDPALVNVRRTVQRKLLGGEA